jgi:hypothetical protein
LFENIAQEEVMIFDLAVGFSTSVATIVIHALFMALVIRVTREQALKGAAAGGQWLLVRVMVACVTVLMAVHTLEVSLWALVYRLVGAVPEGADHLYFAFVNFATLGYGDITPVAEWRLLGPLTALNGVLLSGWSTAVIFEVLRRTLMRSEQI